MRYVIFLMLCPMFLFSCKENHLSQAEKIFGYPLKGKVEYLSKNEKWNNFNGNGYKVEVYKILDLEYFKNQFKDSEFKKFDFKLKGNPLSNTNYSEYIQNGAGFYKTVWTDDEIKTVVVDTVNKRFLYYYSLM